MFEPAARPASSSIALSKSALLLATLALGSTHLAAQGEAYYFATAGMPQGTSGFVDQWCGPDMLPYTADDIDLPERGNIGGTWGFSWIDSDGDKTLGAEERIFVVIRREDDDAHTFSTRSYPQYGVLAESENWIDYHEARNVGPSSSEIGDPVAEGNDFEHNDRAGSGQPAWEDASNYYMFNNDRPDQWGSGGSRYYFEHRNSAGLDEIESLNKFLSFQNNKDDPTTAELTENGACKDSYMRSLDAYTRGLLIPIEDIAGLADGDLDPLFGWYTGDMAKYVREVLGPKLSDPELEVFVDDSGCSASGLPATHLMILQIECPIRINPSGDCLDQSTAEALAAYWGIEPLVPGEPDTEAVYRVSHILLFNDDLTKTDIGVPSFTIEPADGKKRNLWVQDDFWRSDNANVGRYVLDGSWTITNDTSLDRGCQETDKLFLLPGGSPGWFEAPLGGTLDTADGAIYAVAEVGQVDIPVPALGQGGGLPPDTIFQLVLLGGEPLQPVAYAEFSAAASSVNAGGTSGPDGLAQNPTRTMTGPGADIPLYDPLESMFSRYVLRVSPASVRLLEAASDAYTPNDYTDIDAYTELAKLEPGVAGEVRSVLFATSGGLGTLAVAVDGFAVFANLDPDPSGGGRQKPGDENQDGKLDISDPVALLNHLFLGTNPELPCGDHTATDAANKALLDANGDGSIDISDPVSLLNFLFVGGGLPAVCGGDPSCACVSIPGCPENAAGDCAAP